MYCKLKQPLTAKGFCSAGSATDCCTQHPEFESSRQDFLVYKLFVTSLYLVCGIGM